MSSLDKNQSEIRVFLSGKGTRIQLASINGVLHQTILANGKGSYILESFDSLEQAVESCRIELRKNRANIFHVVVRDEILETVSDSSYRYHEARDRRWQLCYATVSMLFFTCMAFSQLAPLWPTQSTAAYVIITALTALVHLAVFWLMGTRSLEGAVVMGFIIVLAAMVLSAWNKHLHRTLRSETHPNATARH